MSMMSTSIITSTNTTMCMSIIMTILTIMPTITPTRLLRAIQAIVDGLPVSEKVRQNAMAVYRLNRSGGVRGARPCPWSRFTSMRWARWTRWRTWWAYAC